jgi:hypothetical protein
MPALAALGVLAVCAFLICLGYAYEYSLGAVFKALAHVFIAATWNGPLGLSIGFAFIGHAIEKLDNGIRDSIDAGITSSEWAWHQTLSAIAIAWTEIGETMHGATLATERSLRWLRHTAMPAAIATALLGPTALLKLLSTQVGHLAHDVGAIKIPAAKVIYRDVPHALTRAEKAAIAALVAVPAAINKTTTIVRPAIEHPIRGIDALKDRVDALAKRLSPTAVVGIVAAAVLSTLGLGWLKCSNVGQVGRRLCGLSRTVLDDLLAGLFVVFGGLGLIVFAHQVLDITHEFATSVRGFWKVSKPGPGGDRGLGQAGVTGTAGSVYPVATRNPGLGDPGA